MQPSVCAESQGSLSIFPRVSQKQLLKHHSLWERSQSASWGRSLTCGLLHHNRGTDCFQNASYACHWSTCHCQLAWKRGSLTECWVTSWEREIEMTQKKGSWQMGLPEVYLPCSRRLWQNQKWKLFLASRSGTRGPLSPLVLHDGIHSLVPSSSDRWSLLKHTYPGTRWVFLVPRQKWDLGSNQGASSNNNGTEHYSPNLIGRHSI